MTEISKINTDSIQNGIILTDEHAIVTVFNKQIENLTGISSAQVIWKSVEDLFDLLQPEFSKRYKFQHI